MGQRRLGRYSRNNQFLYHKKQRVGPYEKAKEWEWKLYHVQVEIRERKKEVAAVLALDIIGGLFMLR